jgi:hypothetical protein
MYRHIHIHTYIHTYIHICIYVCMYIKKEKNQHSQTKKKTSIAWAEPRVSGALTDRSRDRRHGPCDRNKKKSLSMYIYIYIYIAISKCLHAVLFRIAIKKSHKKKSQFPYIYVQMSCKSAYMQYFSELPYKSHY